MKEDNEYLKLCPIVETDVENFQRTLIIRESLAYFARHDVRLSKWRNNLKASPR
jgi:hypothetical protein